jgi:hypothetical protein
MRLAFENGIAFPLARARNGLGQGVRIVLLRGNLREIAGHGAVHLGRLPRFFTCKKHKARGAPGCDRYCALHNRSQIAI